MKKINLSLPIDRVLDTKLKQSVKETQLSRADVVRQILRAHYGLQKKAAA
jgi:hypothetical protein